MSCRSYQRKSFVLDGTNDEEDVAEARGGSSDKVVSGFGGLTIVSAPDDTSWLGVRGIPLGFPTRLPQATPPRGSATLRSTLSGSLSTSQQPKMDL